MSQDNGIVVDMNRITRAEFEKYSTTRDAAENKTHHDAKHLIVKVVVKWPYDQPITFEGYQSLGMLDAQAVDDAVSEAMNAIGKKK